MFESGCFLVKAAAFLMWFMSMKKRLGVRIKTSKRCFESSLRFDSNVLVF